MSLRVVTQNNRLASFTLIELLVVMGIISILAALTIAAGSGVMTKAARSRAAAEIQAMSTGLEGYKTDNGIYPSTAAIALTTNPATVYPSADGNVTGDLYQHTSHILYLALSGQTNFLDTPISGVKAYMQFKINQVGNASSTGAAFDANNSGYVKDPWGASYGYSTGNVVGTTTNSPYSGPGQFDLWSTGGITLAKVTAKPSLTNAWNSNWQ